MRIAQSAFECQENLLYYIYYIYIILYIYYIYYRLSIAYYLPNMFRVARYVGRHTCQ